MGYPYVNKPLTVERVTDIISRLHSPYSDFPDNIDKTWLDRFARVVKKGVWEDNSNGFYIRRTNQVINIRKFHT